MASARKLGKATDHRMAVLRTMATQLFEHGKITTTVTRAKEVRSYAEKMITLAKTNTLHTRRQALAALRSEEVVRKLFGITAPRYAERNGGYTRIIKIGTRRGDAAEIAVLELL
jgi:ribosomal protein L17